MEFESLVFILVNLFLEFLWPLHANNVLEDGQHNTQWTSNSMSLWSNRDSFIQSNSKHHITLASHQKLSIFRPFTRVISMQPTSAHLTSSHTETPWGCYGSDNRNIEWEENLFERYMHVEQLSLPIPCLHTMFFRLWPSCVCMRGSRLAQSHSPPLVSRVRAGSQRSPGKTHTPQPIYIMKSFSTNHFG